MTYFLSGGSKSGKSMLAQNIAKSLPAPHYYLATLRPTDEEDRAIVRRHLQERDGWGFETLECESGILSALTLAPQNGTFLLDSVTALLANEMFRADGSVDFSAGERLADDLVRLAASTDKEAMAANYRMTGDIDMRGVAFSGIGSGRWIGFFSVFVCTSIADSA